MSTDGIHRQGNTSVGEREEREHEIARAGSGVPEQTIRWRFKAVMNRVQCPQCGRRWAVTKNLAIVPRLRRYDDLRLRRQCLEVWWRAGGNEQREDHASQG